jgi:predicted metalloprotease with PDZ domain
MPLAMREGIAECRLRRGAPERSEDSEVNFGSAHTVRGTARVFAVLAVLAVGGCSFATYEPAGGEPFLLYTLTLTDAHLRVVHVNGTVIGASPRRVVLRSIGDASGKRCEPIALGAIDRDGARLPLHARDGVWIVDNRGKDFSFAYDVVLTIENRSAPDVRDMITFIGVDRCRILGRDVFLIPELPVADGIIVDAALAPGWKLAASAPTVRSRIIVHALDELPVTLAVSGAYRHLARDVGGSELLLAIAGTWSFGDEEFFDVVSRIVSEEIALFGASPRSRYLFVCDANPVQGSERFDYYGIHYGGSMLLLLDRKLDRSELMDSPMAIVAHEFFHTWNGEALGPAGDAFLWFTEGVTVYYSYRVLVGANVITDEQYGRRRQAIYERYRANPYVATVPIGEAANSDMHDKHMVNLLYDGGFLAAETLDARLRDETGGRVSLIDVLKRMYEDTGGTGPVDEPLFLRAASELSGKDFSGIVLLLVHTPAPEPLASHSSSLE